MAIGPLELNGTISRTQDFNIIKHNEDNKAFVDQTNIQTQFTKELNNRLNQVKQADDTQKQEFRYDAKEKGNGQYSGQNGKKQKKKEESSEGKVFIKGESRGFDIKV